MSFNRERQTVAVPRYVPVAVTVRCPDHDGSLPVAFLYPVLRVKRQETVTDTLREATRVARAIGLKPLGTGLVEAWQ